MEQGFSKQVSSFIIRCLYKKNTYEFWMHRGFSDEICIQLANRYNKLTSVFYEEYWINKGYTKDEAVELIKNEKQKLSNGSKLSIYDRRKSSRYCKEYWIKQGYSEEEAYQCVLNEQHKIHKIRKPSIKQNNTVSENTRNLISYKLKLKNKQHSPIFIEYWTNQGYSEDEAKLLVHQTKSSKIDITTGNSSKLENKFFNEICKLIKYDNVKRNKYISLQNNVFCPDGRYKNKFIIEFNGTAIHFDNRFFKVGDSNFTGNLYEKKHEQDNLKYNAFIEAGYTVYIVWEHDYKYHKTELLELLAKDINNESYKEGKFWNSASFFNKCQE